MLLAHQLIVIIYLHRQGPLPNTSGHFWLMIWEQKSRAILML
ncbi:hypothetical protein BLA29_015183, partial [Euroglyphus maynei]